MNHKIIVLNNINQSEIISHAHIPDSSHMKCFIQVEVNNYTKEHYNEILSLILDLEPYDFNININENNNSIKAEKKKKVQVDNKAKTATTSINNITNTQNNAKINYNKSEALTIKKRQC